MVRNLDITSSATRSTGQTGPAGSTAAPSAASIDAWLAMLDRMLRLPLVQRESIACELREHLLERSRDLTLRGMNDDEAVRTALDELGSLADLARRFHEAGHLPIRRRIMHGLTIGCGVLVAAAGAFYMAQPGGVMQPSVFHQATGAVAPPRALDQRVDAVVYRGEPLSVVFEALDDRIDSTVLVHWDALEDYGIHPDQAITLDLRNVSLKVVMDSLERSLSRTAPMAWWYGENLIEFGPKEIFDGRSKVLAAYDLTPIIDSMWGRFETPYDEAVAEVIGLLTGFVEPEMWVDNGGSLAQAKVVNGRLFIDAPARMHEKCQWILAELLKGDGVAARLGTGAPGGQETPILDALHGGRTNPEPTDPRWRPVPNTMPDDAARAEAARVRLATTRLRDLFMAVQMFEQATPDEPLTSLEALVERGYLTSDRVASPFGPAPEGEADILFDPAATDLNANVDLSKRVLAYDASMLRARRHTAALFADGHVEVLTADAFAGVLNHAANQGARWEKGSTP